MPTKIEWCDESWPVVTGCSPVSTGCTNCYAARMAATRLRDHPRYKGLAVIRDGKPRWTNRINFNWDVLDQPLHYRKPRMIFVASMGDWLHPSVPDSFIYRVLDITQRTPQHVYQFLTKRANRLPVIIKDFMLDRDLREPPQNIWQGVSVENQAAADERREYLEQCPAAIKFVSYEPALGPVNWTGWEFVSQIISGGESGPGARPSHPNWHRATRYFCQGNDEIAYFFKQWGAWAPIEGVDIQRWGNQRDSTQRAIISTPSKLGPSEKMMYRCGKKAAGHLLDGRTWQEFPVSAKTST